jgi:rod shape-determining protein MreC
MFLNIQAPIWSLPSKIETFKLEALDVALLPRAELVDYCKELKRANLYLQTQLADLKSAINSGNISASGDIYDNFKCEVARVIRRDLATWTSKLIINRGANFGIKPGDGVIAGCSVVGRIGNVYPTVSEIELVSSPAFRISACCEDDNFPVIYRGNACVNLTSYSGVAENITIDSISGVESGEKIRLVSSSLSGIFPSGLTIGKISNVRDIKNGIFATVAVELDSSFLNGLREVVVLTEK